MSEFKIPSGWRRLELGEEILQTDLWLPNFDNKTLGSSVLSDWSNRDFTSNKRLTASHAPHIRKIEGPTATSKEDRPLPPNFKVRLPGEVSKPGDYYQTNSFVGSRNYNDWNLVPNPGYVISENHFVIYPVNSYGHELGPVSYPSFKFTDKEGWIRLPHGTKLAYGDMFARHGDMSAYHGGTKNPMWLSVPVHEYGTRVDRNLPIIRHIAEYEKTVGKDLAKRAVEVKKPVISSELTPSTVPEDLWCPKFPVPKGWRRLQIGEKQQAGDKWLSPDSRYRAKAIKNWNSVIGTAIGLVVDYNSFPCIRRIETSVHIEEGKEDESKKMHTPSLKDTRVYIPPGYILTESRGRAVPEELYCTVKDNGSLRGSVMLSDWNPCGKNHEKVPSFHYIVKAKDKPSDKPVLKEKEISKAEPKGVEPVKEKKEMATTTSPSGFFATLKASALVAGKTAASTTLAEKITELVLGRLPKRVQAMCRLVPRPVLVFAVSTAVYGAACRFDIPGREKVRDVSKYAVDGSMFEAMRLVMGLLDPLFKAIREMVPDDLKQLMNDASDETPKS